MAGMAAVVFTREVDADSAYPALIAALGLELVAMPVTRTEPARDPGALSRAIETGGHAAILVSSARGAAALIAAAGGRALPEVWAVGPASLRALMAGGIAAKHPDGAIDGSSLAHAMIAACDLAGRRVLVPRAEHGRDEAIAILRDAGALVDDVIAYRTVPTPADAPVLAEGRALVEAGEAAVCVVFAPSQVSALETLLGPLGELVTPFVAIGETTAAALREAGVATVAVAASPTPEGLANAIAAVYPAGR
jgi:uroporphyrinogen-III synthase